MTCNGCSAWSATHITNEDYILMNYACQLGNSLLGSLSALRSMRTWLRLETLMKTFKDYFHFLWLPLCFAQLTSCYFQDPVFPARRWQQLKLIAIRRRISLSPLGNPCRYLSDRTPSLPELRQSAGGQTQRAVLSPVRKRLKHCLVKSNF